MVLYHLHTRPLTLCKLDLVPLTYTNTNNCSVLYHIYIASLINCIHLMMVTVAMAETCS